MKKYAIDTSEVMVELAKDSQGKNKKTKEDEILDQIIRETASKFGMCKKPVQNYRI